MKPRPYHHGDLRTALLREASTMLREGGQEALTLRKLADRAGVSPPALYHHFHDKNDLLCAIAEKGFEGLAAAVTPPPEGASLDERVSSFVHGYIGFAVAHPETYDLMFGRSLWKAGSPTASLRAVAFATFKQLVAHVASVVDGAAPRHEADVLRLAQVTWAMLHGLCRQRIDGIYVDEQDHRAMADEAVRFLLGRLGRLPTAQPHPRKRRGAER